MQVTSHPDYKTEGSQLLCTLFLMTHFDLYIFIIDSGLYSIQKMANVTINLCILGQKSYLY